MSLSHEAQLLRLAELRHRATAERAWHQAREGGAQRAERDGDRAAGATGDAEAAGGGPESGQRLSWSRWPHWSRWHWPLWSRWTGRSRRQRRWTKAV